MKSKFQREQRKRIVFQKQKRKAKVPIFQEISLASMMRTVGKYGASRKVEWGFYGTFNGSAKGGSKRKKKEQRIFMLNQRPYWKSSWKPLTIFAKRSSIVDIWQGSEYASNSEYARVAQNSEWHGQLWIFDRVLNMP